MDGYMYVCIVIVPRSVRRSSPEQQVPVVCAGILASEQSHGRLRIHPDRREVRPRSGLHMAGDLGGLLDNVADMYVCMYVVSCIIDTSYGT